MEHHIRYDGSRHALILLDQRMLPTRQEDFVCQTTEDIVTALHVMAVRGAPAIGVTAAWGCVLAAREAAGAGDHWRPVLDGLLERIATARPTAVNLQWAVERMRRVWKTVGHAPLGTLVPLWESEARRIHRDDIETNRAMGRHGAALINDGDTVMTHCNAGALATAGYGTALGVIRGAVDEGKRISVIANETRPFLQGARLTAFELHEDGIPVTVACDNACGLLMRRGMVQKVVVGADRIAANGDAANKIGTYSVALLAREHGVPFYVAAPLSTIDRNTPDGDQIPLEDRTPREVTHMGDTRITPVGVPVFNFAFDVTPAALLAGIVTEMGVLRPPYAESIAEAFRKAGQE